MFCSSCSAKGKLREERVYLSSQHCITRPGNQDNRSPKQVASCEEKNNEFMNASAQITFLRYHPQLAWVFLHQLMESTQYPMAYTEAHLPNASGLLQVDN